jgi:glycosyltransferase involved in cell wall biosynthesis
VPPYASVIVPTHDRFATLAVTVASVQRQTVQEIEIIISGDGATADVTNAARALAAQDSRVRFLEFEKAPGSGGENRDRAIRESARAERIFYTDDDDLWLPEHIETIGPQLDRFDVVDTLPVSATACGRLALTCVNSACETMRSLLVQDKLKFMYDTHLAHRRTTYLALGGAWRKAQGGDAVFQVLGTFAAANASWVTLPIATAVSLHGGARATFSSAERYAEIVAWSARLKEYTPQMLTADAHPAWPFFHCLNLFPPEAGDMVHDYLRRLGLRLPEDSVGSRPDTDLLSLPLDQTRSDEMDTTFALHRGDLLDTARIESVAPLLLDTVKVAVSSWAFLRRALRRLPLAKALTLVQSLPRSDPRTNELLAIFEVYLQLWARQPKQALPLAERLAVDVRFVPHEAELLLGEVHLALGNFDEGFSYLSRAAARENRGSAISVRLAVALMKAGRLDDARLCLERIESRLGGLPHAVALRRQLTALETERHSSSSRP